MKSFLGNFYRHLAIFSGHTVLIQCLRLEKDLWDEDENSFKNAYFQPLLYFPLFTLTCAISVTRKKLPNVYTSCPKLISVEKLQILTPLQKLPKIVGDLGKLIVAKGFKKLPKVQKIPNLVTLLADKLYKTRYGWSSRILRTQCLTTNIQFMNSVYNGT